MQDRKIILIVLLLTHMLAILYLTLTLISIQVQASVPVPTRNCTLQSCVKGGPIVDCWEKLKAEYQTKLRSCSVVKIKTGYSAYAMVSNFRNACIEKDASLWLHLPYGRGYRTRPIATEYYRNRIRASLWAKFVSKGGTNRNGLANAWFMTRIPANETGIPLCK
jgi:hypothetical protein